VSEREREGEKERERERDREREREREPCVPPWVSPVGYGQLPSGL
jgi:hypothetical protein